MAAAARQSQYNSRCVSKHVFGHWEHALGDQLLRNQPPADPILTPTRRAHLTCKRDFIGLPGLNSPFPHKYERKEMRRIVFVPQMCICTSFPTSKRISRMLSSAPPPIDLTRQSPDLEKRRSDIVVGSFHRHSCKVAFNARWCMRVGHFVLHRLFRHIWRAKKPLIYVCSTRHYSQQGSAQLL